MLKARSWLDVAKDVVDRKEEADAAQMRKSYRDDLCPRGKQDVENSPLARVRKPWKSPEDGQAANTAERGGRRVGELEEGLASGRASTAVREAMAGGGGRRRRAGTQDFKVRELRTACERNTGLVTDHCHPRRWLVLDDSLLQGVVDTIKRAEDTAKWPEHASFLSFFLVPKSAGGLRTIAILPDPLMTGGCLPRLDAEAPEEVRLGLPRQVSRREAVWEQRLETETAVGRGRSTVVASLTILCRCGHFFEVLTLLQVWYCVTRAGFPRRLLRMGMGYFSLRRLLVHDGSSSDMTERTAALIADSRFSCVLSARCLADKITNS